MNVTASLPDAAQWAGPGAPVRPRGRFDWNRLLWALVLPQRRHRVAFTIPGVFLMGLSMGIGTAAYNTASNILFITLSLLLACLLLSGLLSWFNFMDLSWRLPPPGAWRAGHDTLVSVQVRNDKHWLPSYGLWFDLTVTPRLELPVVEEKEIEVRAALAAYGSHVVQGRLTLRERIEPGGQAAAEWAYRPDRRGPAVLQLVAVGSLFPFGFIRKSLGTDLRQTVLVRPAPVDYQWHMRGGGGADGQAGQRTTQAGGGEDLLALRRYQRGDSHRLIHWKASARLGRMMVRQFAAETQEGFALRVDTPTVLWRQPEQFELLCRFAASLAEDLFAAGRLRTVQVNGGPVRSVRGTREVEAFLDDLAVVTPLTDFPTGRSALPASCNLITFAPDGLRGVLAHVDGNPAASA